MKYGLVRYKPKALTVVDVKGGIAQRSKLPINTFAGFVRYVVFIIQSITN